MRARRDGRRRRDADAARDVRAGHERSPDPMLVGRLRGSVLLLGPLLARRGLGAPGAARRRLSARRTITTHLQALVALGARAARRAGHALEAPDGLIGASIYLDEASVTGTETALLAAAAAKGPTPRSATPRPSRTSSSCAGSCSAMGVGIEGEGRRRSRRGPARLRAPNTARRRLHRSRQLGVSSPRSPAARSRSPARAPRTWKVVAAPLLKHGRAVHLDDDRFVVEPSRSTAARRRSRPACGRGFRATWSASSRCWRRRPRAGRWSTTGCTSCGCSRSSS